MLNCIPVLEFKKKNNIHQIVTKKVNSFNLQMVEIVRI